MIEPQLKNIKGPYNCIILTLPFLQIFSKNKEMTDKSLQVKTLQTILIIFQSRLQPQNEVIVYFLPIFIRIVIGWLFHVFLN